MIDEEYSEKMGEFMTSFDEFVVLLDQMIPSYDGSQEWIDAYVKMYKSATTAAENLFAMTPSVPATYEESHTNITAAVTSVIASMKLVAESIDPYNAGDEDLSTSKMEDATTAFQIAAELWNSAKE